MTPRCIRYKKTLTITMVIFWIGLVVSSPVFAQSKNRLISQKDPVIAKIDSVPLRIADIEDKQINDLRSQLYQLLNYKLIKTAVDKLAKRYPEFEDKPTIYIKDKQAKAFYNENNLQGRGSYEQLYPMIKKHLEDTAMQDHYKKLYDKAIEKRLIISYLVKPNDFLLRVPVETAYLRGNKNAAVMVLEFSDYQCPFCSRVQPTLSLLRKRYKQTVMFGYRHAPLEFHREADEAAIAVECARDQGKFEEYHSLLFKNPRKQFVNDLKTYAEKVKVKNLSTFNKCLDTEKYRKQLENDQKAAAAAGIRGAPGFVIGRYDQKTKTITGEIVSGAQPESVFRKVIEKYLKRT